MAHRPLLHELLKEDQDPFHLKSHIANKRSQFKNSSTLKLRKRRLIIHESETPTNLCKHACFFSFNASPDVRRSPFLDLPSPAKSPNAAAFLHVPSRTAALLLEAAMRIQKQQRSNEKPYTRTGFGLLGSFLKRLTDRSKNRKRAIEDSDFVRVSEEKECVRMSCSCSKRWLNSADWRTINEDKSLDFEASTSSRVSVLSEEICGDFCLGEESCFCSNRFRFSLPNSPSSYGRRTPEFYSPSASPSRRMNQENKNYESRNSRGDEKEEQCSPVSVLEPPFCEEDERQSHDAEEDDFDVERSYENVQRAKQLLMYRLQRFEKLAELDHIELEKRLLEGSDNEEDAEPMRQHNVETYVPQMLDKSNLKYNNCRMKRVVDGKRHMILMREVELNTIGLDLKEEFDVWTKFTEQVQDTAAEIELAIYGLLVDELKDDLFRSTQQMEMVR